MITSNQLLASIMPQCTGTPLATTGERMCTLCDFLSLIDNIIKFVALTTPLVVIIIIAWGSFIMMTAGGSEERFFKGKKIITSAIIGLLIVLGAWIIVSTVFLLLTGSYEGPFPLPWYQVSC